MRLLVQHRSHYLYAEPAQLGTHTLRLHPAGHAKAHIETYHLGCEQAERVRWSVDPYGNRVAQLTFPWPQRLRELDILVEMAVEIRPVNPFDFVVDHQVEQLGFTYPVEVRSELAPFLTLDDPALVTGPRFEAFLAELPATGGSVDAVVEINRAVNQRVAYVVREEPGVWTPEQTLSEGRGSCRDSAVLLLAILRRRGLAARFVSGYLIQIADEGMLPDLPKGLERDVVDLHAWVEVYFPGAGWIGLDATSGLLTSEGHIPLAAASIPALAAPLQGTADQAASAIHFEMSVARLGHEPRPTAPYTDEAWARLRAVGRVADQRLVALGLTLTMGGEPTFNAREDTDAPEWNGEALGPSKWRCGLRLAEALRDRLLPGGLLLRRMGKHYPGESMPRWALEVIGRDHDRDREDEARLWSRDPSDAVESAALDNADERLARAIADALGLGEGLQPSFEDPWYFLHEESTLPTDVDPLAADLAADLADGEARARLARVLDRGLATPAGWVLPLRREPDAEGQPRWRTQTWSFRRGRLILLPGDSPIGLRLPLGSLAGEPIAVQPSEQAYAPLDPRRALDEAGEPLPEQRRLASQAPDNETPTGKTPAGKTPAGKTIRTALCVEVRDRQVYVFLPPLSAEADFITLVTLIDRLRQELRLPVLLEGYPPPSGPLLRRFAVTPDPGVLEVNIPPTSDSDRYVALIEAVYDAALHAGLHSEKYLVDGRQAGSGGGHHLTLGGPTPLDSPFLRRPDLLASLITFLQHHPSLSYLFTGLFVGPTSQAPRVDEARHEQLYELEIALQRAHAQARLPEPPPPWLADMLFRHLLVDVTGNAHRTELCLDKLFAPHGGASGRQGLLEFRAFEMPPHPRMAAAQMLLLRCLVAALAESGYPETVLAGGAPIQLVRWGQRLHDRFLLPYWLWQDFEAVLAFLARHGFALEAEHYRPFLELRCPLVGALQLEDLRLEVRNAIEPWHVLGEEAGAGGTARYVDSSLERIELRADGLIPERHAVLVNGLALPMRPGADAGLHLIGVRFRAWAPPHALHGWLGVHHPLHIDILDRWSGRSLGACTYHVWHPEGRAFASPPLTRFEAAARRSQRFTRGDQSPWPVDWRWAAGHGDTPYTIDLRRCEMDRLIASGDGRGASEAAPPGPRHESVPIIAWPGTPKSPRP